MKDYNIVLMIILASFVGCGSPQQDHIGHEHHTSDIGKDEPSDLSIYNLTSDWVNQQEDTMPLSSLSGYMVVMAMIYTHCEYICPRIVADMQIIEQGVMPAMNDNVKYALVSIDPERDTPQRLRTFANEHQLDLTNWILLNGDDDDILDLAAVLGVRYKKAGDNDFTHSNIITVLNQNGEIIHQQIGLNADPWETIKSIHDNALEF